MGMGGAGAAQSPEDRARAAFAAGITDPKELAAIGQGMTPMSYTNYMNAKNLVLGGKGQPPGAYQDVRKYGLQMSNLANGGLLRRGLSELDTVLNSPSTTAGTLDRTAARYGLDTTNQNGSGVALDTSIPDMSNRVGLKNQVRSSLVNAQMGMRLGGIST